jgi:ParB/RepB/Spo0J family partition protein
MNGTYSVVQIPIHLLHADHEWNSRGQQIIADVEEFSRELLSSGRVITPVVVRRMNTLANPVDGFTYSLISGFRRYMASVLLGWETIPAFVMDCTEEKAREWNLKENIHRKELTLVQIAHSLALTYPDEIPDSTIAGIYELSQRKVKVCRALAKMPSRIQDEVTLGLWNIVELEKMIREPDRIDETYLRMREEKLQNKVIKIKDRRPRTKNEIIHQQSRLLSLFAEGLWSQFSRWSVGELSDTEFDDFILRELNA